MDEFAVDLDKVLDDFEQSEVGEGPDVSGLGQAATLDDNRPRLPLNLPAFEALDLDLAEADFAPSPWKYDALPLENGDERNHLPVVSSPTRTTSDNILRPQSEPVHNRIEADDIPTAHDLHRNNIGMSSAVDVVPGAMVGAEGGAVDVVSGAILGAEGGAVDVVSSTSGVVTGGVSGTVDVVSACLHAFSIPEECDPAVIREQHENEIHEEVVTSPPDIVCSAPDLVSSAIVGVDVLSVSCADPASTNPPELLHEPSNYEAVSNESAVWRGDVPNVLRTGFTADESGYRQPVVMPNTAEKSGYNEKNPDENIAIGAGLDALAELHLTARPTAPGTSPQPELINSISTDRENEILSCPTRDSETIQQEEQFPNAFRNFGDNSVTDESSNLPISHKWAEADAVGAGNSAVSASHFRSSDMKLDIVEEVASNSNESDERLHRASADPECMNGAVSPKEGIARADVASESISSCLKSADLKSHVDALDPEIQETKGDIHVGHQAQGVTTSEILESELYFDKISDAENRIQHVERRDDGTGNDLEIQKPEDPDLKMMKNEHEIVSEENLSRESWKEKRKSGDSGKIERRDTSGRIAAEQRTDVVAKAVDEKADATVVGSSDSALSEMFGKFTEFEQSVEDDDFTKTSSETGVEKHDSKTFEGTNGDRLEQQHEFVMSADGVDQKRSSHGPEVSSRTADDEETSRLSGDVKSDLDLVSDAVLVEKMSEFCELSSDSSLNFAPNGDNLSMSKLGSSESFTVVTSHDAEGAAASLDSNEMPEIFGNLGDETLQSLMNEVAEEMEQMMNAKAESDVHPQLSQLTDKAESENSLPNSFEHQAIFVDYNKSEADEIGGGSSISNSKTDSEVAAGAPDLCVAQQPSSDSRVGGAVESDRCLGVAHDSKDLNIDDRSLSMSSPSGEVTTVPSGYDTPHADEDGAFAASYGNSEDANHQSREGRPGDIDGVSSGIDALSADARITLEDAQPTVAAGHVAQPVSHPQSLPIAQPAAPSFPTSPTIPLCSNIGLEITQLGKVAPVWLPDAEASRCMECEIPFSFTRRRHHCRACGKVFCHGCSSLRATLSYLDNKQDRVCSRCYQDLVRASYYERTLPGAAARLSPGESDMAAAAGLAQAALESPQLAPSVSTPTGVLRKQGSIKVSGEAKQVMFSDGIRPGGDLTDLDGSSESRPSRRSRKSDKSTASTASAAAASAAAATASASQTRSQPESRRMSCLIPNSGLPPIVTVSASRGEIEMKDNIPAEVILQQIHNDPNPVTFAINRDVLVTVKIVNLDCCVNRKCWCFTTKGLCSVGQDEVVIVLECLPDEKMVPMDILHHLHILYEMASHGNTVNNLDHTVLPSGSLGSHEIGGFLYVRQTFQCLQKLVLPDPPYLFGLLLLKWEMSWARVFPLRLMFRLGAEFRYYPCPLISVRNRKPVYGEIGHTIMNLLADFHNYQYMVPRVNGLVIHMEDKRTTVSIPRNRYNMLMKILSNSDDHVIALGASFSSVADSHLVCLQNDDGNYLTQAINIQNRPRRVTGACFIVFNGALKPTSGLRAKSSIVEDGLMVQITSDAMSELKQALSETRDYKILCGSIEIPQPDEMVVIEWNNDEKNINAGVKSPIDGLTMYGVDSIRIHGSTDYAKDKLAIRWTEVFVLQNTGTATSSETPTDVSNLAESLAQACCQALVPHLDKLAFEMSTKIGLRVTIDAEQVGYEVGSRGVRLPDFCMNDLDEKLIGLIHGAASHARSGPIVLELIFHIIHPYTASAGSALPVK